MRFVLASLCFLGFAAPAAAQSGDATPGVLDQVYACASVTGEAERLACYDGAVGRLREAQTSGNLVAVDRAAAQEIEREAFGYSLPNLPRIFGRNVADADALAEMRMEIASIDRPRGGGRAAFTMTNGQVWVQTDETNPRNARVGRTVTVRTAALGTYLMSVEGGGAALRVRRQQ